jgi:Tol biopolymer transport system component
VPLQTLLAGPTFNGRIFFTTNQSLIYAIESGKAPVLISKNEQAQDLYPSVSANGQTVFYSDHLQYDFELYRLNISTGQRSKFIPFYTNSASLNKEGTKVVFDGRPDRSGYFNLYTVNSNGSNIQQLTTENHRNRTPVWSPDGSLIAYGSRRHSRFDIYTIKPDGSDEVWHSQNLDLKETRVRWSINGQSLFFVDSADRISSLNIHTGEVTAIPGQTGQCQAIKDIALSPEGNQVSFLGQCQEGVGLYISSVQQFSPQWLAATTFGNNGFLYDSLAWSN